MRLTLPPTWPALCPPWPARAVPVLSPSPLIPFKGNAPTPIAPTRRCCNVLEVEDESKYTHLAEALAAMAARAATASEKAGWAGWAVPGLMVRQTRWLQQGRRVGEAGREGG